MDVRALVDAADPEPGSDRRLLFTALLSATVHLRAPVRAAAAVTRPDTGQRAVPVFLTAEDAGAFWRWVAPDQPAEVEEAPFVAAAAAALPVGGMVIDPAGAGVELDRGELMQLAAAEVPGEFAAWLQDPGHVGRQPGEVLAQLRRAHVLVLAGRGGGDAQRLYLLEKSEDGSLAVACFSSRQTLAQFAAVRRLAAAGEDYAVALYSGEHCIQVAAGMGAYAIIDPESPWETQLEPTLIQLHRAKPETH